MTSLDDLQDFLNSKIAAMDFPGEPANLYDPVRYMLGIGGKRMRPLLVLMACELFNGNKEDALQAALGMEVFHNFTLLHDDIMDQAPLRRSFETVHVRWNPGIAILSGDAMFVKACELISMVPDNVLRPCMNIFFKTSLEVCEGQQFDMDFEGKISVSLDRYMEMIRLKTAVLIGCCLKMGALIGGAGNDAADHLYEFGVNLGLAFQLQDDLLDVYGDAGKFGKQVGGDIRSNKKTFLMLSALEKAKGDEYDELNGWINAAPDQVDANEKVIAVTAIYDSLHIRELTEEMMNKYYKTALDNLDAVAVPEPARKPLQSLAARLMVREA